MRDDTQKKCFLVVLPLRRSGVGVIPKRDFFLYKNIKENNFRQKEKQKDFSVRSNKFETI